MRGAFPAAVALWTVLGPGTGAPRALAAAADPAVLFCAEIEGLPAASGVVAAPREGAAGGQAATLAADACVVWGLDLPAGEYTLLLRGFAPAGDQDALFLTCGARRERFTIPIGRWGQRAMAFRHRETGAATFRVDGQEAGVLVDRVAVVAGSRSESDVDLAACALTPPTVPIPVDRLPRFERPCRLAEFPPVGVPDDSAPLFREDFERPPVPGLAGTHRLGLGRSGQGALLAMPDGRFEAALPDPSGLACSGTVEWWVRPRPAAHVWSDQGWHYFLHAAPAEGSTVRMDLYRRPASDLTLSLSAGKDGPVESLSLNTSSLDPEAWHHILVSWEAAADSLDLWLLVDGRGRHLHSSQAFPPFAFRRLCFGNAPPDLGLPGLPMDGALDEIVARPEPVRRRLTP